MRLGMLPQAINISCELGKIPGCSCSLLDDYTRHVGMSDE